MQSDTAHADIVATKDPSAYITKDRQTLRGKRVGPILHLADERARLAQLTWNNFGIKRLGATIGAEISGVNLTTDLPSRSSTTSVGLFTNSRSYSFATNH